MSVTEIVLKKPVTAHNETLHVLELREPRMTKSRPWVFLSLFPVRAVLNWTARWH